MAKQKRFTYAVDEDAATKLIREAMDTLYSPSFLTQICHIEAPFDYYGGVIPKIDDIFCGEERKMAYQFMSGMFSSPDSLPNFRVEREKCDFDWYGNCYTLFIDADRALGVTLFDYPGGEHAYLLFRYSADAKFREGHGAECVLKVEYLAAETEDDISKEIWALYEMLGIVHDKNKDSNWCFYSFHE